jgi:hypothetical protein
MTAPAKIPRHPASMMANEQITIARPWVEFDPVLTCVPLSPSGHPSTTWPTKFAPTSLAARIAPSSKAASTASTSLRGAWRSTASIMES